MFDVGWSELLVIGVVALIAIGPKELPGVLRAVGQWMGKIRRMAAEFQGQFHEAMREIEQADIKKQVDEATSGLNAKFDPLDFSDSTWKPDPDPPATPASTGSESAATPPSGTPEPPLGAPEPPPVPELQPPVPDAATAAAGEGTRGA